MNTQKKIVERMINDVGCLPVYLQLFRQGAVYRESIYVGRKTIGKLMALLFYMTCVIFIGEQLKQMC